MKKGKGKEGDLVDVVFSWSLADVLNKDLLKDEVKEIPTTFQSLHHYFGSFISPLVEETHADLQSSMEALAQVPFLKILPGAKYKPGKEGFVYSMVVVPEPHRTGPVEGGKEPYVPSKDDIIAFSEVKPAIASDLNRERRSYVLAVITNVNPANGPPYKIKVRASKQVEFPVDKKQSLLAIFLMNIKTNERIWKALHMDEISMQRNLGVIKTLLDVDSTAVRSCDLCVSGEEISIEGKNLKKKLLDLNLNASQTDAILSSVVARQCNHRHPVKLIWGPPGTGKTKTVSTLLWILMSMKCKTLTCAPTNVAVKEVASRLLRLVGGSCKKGNCSLGDMLLFGNKDRMIIDDDLQDIFFDYRADRLAECFAPSSGWTHHLDSMIGFLQDCVPRYRLYLENTEEKSDSLTFQEFIRKRFSLKAKALRDCIRIMCTHLPTSFISRGMLELMASVCDLFQSFESLLCMGDIAHKELEDLFKLPDEMISTKLKDGSIIGSVALLCNTRNECIRILGHLHQAFQIPKLLKKGLIREFCFKSATLIFCTVSSSFRLHSEHMEPLEMLVIDEAAQLKECESTIPLQLLGMQHAILIGDERQLPAMVKSKVSDEAGFGRSLFERLSSLGHGKHLLDMQYRMHPSISSFPNANFYDNQILDAPNVKCKSYRRHYLPGEMYGSYSFINISNGKEIYKNGCSPKNVVEVAVVLQLVKNLFEAYLPLKQKLSVGVISPYTAQVSEIQNKLGKIYQTDDNFTVSVRSIDGFQGGEEDVIIISTVRSNLKGKVGFLSSTQRTNVALTRARHCLWILGNELTLIKSNDIWKKIVLDTKNRGCFFNAETDNRLAEAIMLELGQFNHLLCTDSILFNRARWKVEFTENFKNSFARIKGAEIKKQVVQVLEKLSSGWRPNKGDLDGVSGSSFQLLKKYIVQGRCLVLSVDLLKHSTYVCQVLMFWDILPLVEIPELVKRLDNIFGKYTKDHMLKCKFKCEEGELIVPMIWKIGPGDDPPKNIEKTIKNLSNQLDSLSISKEHVASTSKSSHGQLSLHNSIMSTHCNNRGSRNKSKSGPVHGKNSSKPSSTTTHSKSKKEQKGTEGLMTKQVSLWQRRESQPAVNAGKLESVQLHMPVQPQTQRDGCCQ